MRSLYRWYFHIEQQNNSQMCSEVEYIVSGRIAWIEAAYKVRKNGNQGHIVAAITARRDGCLLAKA